MFCQCGCGQLTKIATQSRTNRGWIKGQPKRFIVRHHNNTKDHIERIRQRCLGKPLSFEHRAAISHARGNDAICSPFLPWKAIIHFANGRWVGTDPRDKKLRPHAKIVWEYLKGIIPEGFRVHHKNGDPTEIISDRLENLMLLSEEWNLKFMPDIALGFGIPESEVTAAYLHTENLPYEDRFPEVCKLLLTRRVS